MRHLGDRVATLVDGRMAPEEEERAWVHVHGCPLCSDAVQREGWVKRRLAGLSYAGAEPLPPELAGTLRDPSGFSTYPGVLGAPGVPDDETLAGGGTVRRRRAGLAVLGAGSLSAAMMGVVALGAAPADAPGLDLRVPAGTATAPAAVVVSTRPQEGRPQEQLTGATDLSRLDPGTAARQVAVAVGAGLRMGL